MAKPAHELPAIAVRDALTHTAATAMAYIAPPRHIAPRTGLGYTLSP